LPLIIYNRGGNREFSKLTPWMQYGFYDFVSNGFVVIGSQYRGNDGGEGHEEFGGADVHDVVNLIPLAKSLGYVDMSNVFMFGESRGGMMTYLALTNNIAVNAVAKIDEDGLQKVRQYLIVDAYDTGKRIQQLIQPERG
jgi:dipeptidyl aminopeptidase/acylaminoacyl peptidase